MSITPYLNLITSEHRNKPKYIAFVSSFLSKVDDGMTVSGDMSGNFDVDTAVGVQLDTIGAIVGANRDVGIQLSSGTSILDDDHYRTLIKAKIAQNQWDGTIPSIYALWSTLFPGSILQIIDNQDMTMQAIVTGLSDEVSLELITAGLIIPKPAGVTLTIIGSTSISQTRYQAGIVTGMSTEILTVPKPTSIPYTLTLQPVIYPTT